MSKKKESKYKKPASRPAVKNASAYRDAADAFMRQPPAPDSTVGGGDDETLAELCRLGGLQEGYGPDARNTAARVAKLSAVLAEAGRIEDIIRIAEDGAFRDQLYIEFDV